MQKPLDRLFGLQAKRLADLIGQQGRDAYSLLNINIDAKWNSIIMALSEKKSAASTELAKRTGLSRQLVESRIRKMETETFIVSESDPKDARRRLYRLNPNHERKFQELHDVMANFEAVYEVLWREIGVDLASALGRAESALKNVPLQDRYAEMFSHELARKEPV